MLGFHRLMTARLGAASASEWLRLDLSSAQIKLLFWLASAGEQPMSQVARALGIGMPAATSLVDKLVDHRLATREHSPVDRRVVLVRATDEGHTLVARLRQINEDEWRQVLARVPEEALPALSGAIAVLTKALQEAAAESGAFCPSPAGSAASRLHTTGPATGAGQGFDPRSVREQT
jgi:DNA-binding MarR family transcriptional regulator